MLRYALFVLIASLLAIPAIAEDEAKEFSGPQKGETITPFNVRGVLGDKAGEEYDLVKTAKGQPIVLMFVHEVNRPSVGIARVVMNYAASQKKAGLNAGLVFLTADATETEDWTKRASGALPQGVPIGISTDGVEGPGAYGLNRKVTVTVLVAKDEKVTANFALVQPSVAVDAPKIIEAIAAAAGVKAPTAEELQKLVAPMRPPARGSWRLGAPFRFQQGESHAYVGAPRRVFRPVCGPGDRDNSGGRRRGSAGQDSQGGDGRAAGQVPQGQDRQMPKAKEGDDVVYDIEFKQEGRKCEADIKEDGAYINYEKAIEAKDLPKAVRDAVEKRYPRATLQEIMEETEVMGERREALRLRGGPGDGRQEGRGSAIVSRWQDSRRYRRWESAMRRPASWGRPNLPRAC